MKRSSKASRTTSGAGDDQPETSPLSDRAAARDPDWKFGLDPMKIMGLSLVLMMGFLALLYVSVGLWDPSSDVRWAAAVSGRSNNNFNPQQAILQENNDVVRPARVPNDKLLGNLLPTGFDEQSCLSRYHHSLLRRQATRKKASPHLISRLRRYEARHKRCGPQTHPYELAVKNLVSGETPAAPTDCKYVVWVSFSGLGNRMLTLASAFLYALLTERVLLLLDRGPDIPDLFCEPFPEATWLLPRNFPLADRFDGFDRSSNESYGNLLKTNSPIVKPYAYLHLVHDYGHHDKLFFCSRNQGNLEKIPWLVVKTDNYFIPSLFLIPSFDRELNDLFPDKGSVFHLLGRYLFHPTNPVWGLITRYHDAYLSKVDTRVGLQIRVFDTEPGPFNHILDQILSCAAKWNILPQINRTGPALMNPRSGERRKVAVLVTSLSPGYFERIRDLYYENPTLTGESIGVYQPSQEGYQQSEKQNHNRKAWAEMYLLSLMDKLVTSSWSTFGYVAQGLGGVRPWILYKPENRTAPDPPCRRAMSMEPCFHAPPFYDCKTRRGVDTGTIVPHVKHCEDISWGLKLV